MNPQTYSSQMHTCQHTLYFSEFVNILFTLFNPLETHRIRSPALNIKTNINGPDRDYTYMMGVFSTLQPQYGIIYSVI